MDQAINIKGLTNILILRLSTNQSNPENTTNPGKKNEVHTIIDDT